MSVVLLLFFFVVLVTHVSAITVSKLFVAGAVPAIQLVGLVFIVLGSSVSMGGAVEVVTTGVVRSGADVVSISGAAGAIGVAVGVVTATVIGSGVAVVAMRSVVSISCAAGVVMAGMIGPVVV